MKETTSLYKVILKGLKYSICSNRIRGTSFVIAKNPDEAYQKVKQYLDDKDYGYSRERELESVELVANDNFHGDTNYMLFL